MYLVISTLKFFGGHCVLEYDTIDEAKAAIEQMMARGEQNMCLAQEIPYTIKPAEVEF